MKHFANDAGAKVFRHQAVAWFRKNGRDLPWRHTIDPYAILVSEIMLQQTQVATVIPYFVRWMSRFPDAQTLADADESSVLSEWQGLGYYSRARNLHRAAKHLVEKHAGVFPRKLDEIRSLPGVGRYTAGAVATFAFDQPEPIVDANIARLLARLLDLQTPIDTAAGSEALLSHARDLQPRHRGRLFNSALMELGALVCIPRVPKCVECPVRGACRAANPSELPRKRPRRAIVAIEENCAYVVSNDSILLEQQTTARWRGLWKLPALEDEPAHAPMLQSSYPFTHHRVQLSVFKMKSVPLTKNQSWHSLASLPAMSSPHHRAVLQILESVALRGRGNSLIA